MGAQLKAKQTEDEKPFAIRPSQRGIVVEAKKKKGCSRPRATGMGSPMSGLNPGMSAKERISQPIPHHFRFIEVSWWGGLLFSHGRW